MSDTVYYCTIINSNDTIENFENDDNLDISDTGVPDTGVPDTSVPDTGVLDTGVPDTSVPATSAPATTAPANSAPPTSAPAPTDPIDDWKESWVSGFSNNEIIISVSLLILSILIVLLY